MQKKSLAATFGAVVLIGAIGIGSTFAYLTDKTNTVENTFTVGKVQISLLESEVARENGTGGYVAVKELNTTTNHYTEIDPGETLYKDPTVIVSDESLDSWLFVQIQYNDAQFEAPEVDLDKWALVSEESVNHTRTVVYAYKTYVTAGQKYQVFDHVDFIDSDAADDVDDITIKAFAIQQYTFESYKDVLDQVAFD